MNRARFWIGLGVVLAAAVLLRAPALRAPFFADDWLFLDQVRSHSLGTELTSPDPFGNFFRPLGRQVRFRCWGALGRESPVLFHAANLALLLVSLVLSACCWAWDSPRGRAPVGAVLLMLALLGWGSARSWVTR